MKYKFKFHVGQLVRDVISGFEGRITGMSVWITGCNTVGVKSQNLHDGKPIDGVWFDETTLELIDSVSILDKKEIVESVKRSPGGPHPTPKQHVS